MEREDARKLSPEAQQERRRQVVRAYKRGVNRRQIARDLGLSYSSVCMIVDRYKKDGLRGIECGQRGRPTGSCRTLNKEQEERVQRLIQEKRPEQLKMDFALWNRAAVMLLIERECGVRIPVRSVGEYLKRWGDAPNITHSPRLRTEPCGHQSMAQ
jgi:transposase